MPSFSIFSATSLPLARVSTLSVEELIVKGPNGELLNKGQGAPTTVYSNQYSFNVKPGITILSVRTVSNANAGLKKSRWAYSSDWRFAKDQKPWAIISSPQQ